MNVIEHNRQAWNREAAAGGPWSIPVDDAVVARARTGDWAVVLTPTIPVPRNWFGELAGRDVLCLASAGGQQAPILAAAGSNVTSYDLSDAQLALDRSVAERNSLPLRCERGNMQDLSRFADASFDLIFHATSNCFVPALAPVWTECARVLRPGGRLLAGFMNPAWFLFDHEAAAAGEPLVARYAQPYSEPGSLDDAARATWEASGLQAVFGHTLTDQIGGQIAAGFAISGFFEDMWSESVSPVCRLLPASFATLAIRA
jgi:SAM-dependent methyltransferase